MSRSSDSPAVPARLTDRKRLAILDAAMAEFRAHGFDGTSMDRVAAAAGASKRTVYNHFPSKDALFVEIVRHLWQRGISEVSLAYSPARPLREQLVELLLQKLRMLDDAAFVDLSRVAIAEAMRSPEHARDIIARLGSKEEGTTVWIRAALADGRLRPLQPEFASQQLQSLVKGFAFWPQIALGQAPLSAQQKAQVAESTADLFLSHYASG
ncbi:TetR/AcrR family transcriptional regulator [Xanthomonas sp. AmX2]|uniref:TetR/AcrR family transcriptional regulator n=1 Tax=Xanthomonas sp. TaxID=29446 RepID=UPI001981C2B3|nr:TetR/AcrR family transcriptional regulator [Xanthomonas sp.]MBN6150615.1 TetR/AcrR family transcriptional regulator [Xanthomonas sp.]